MGDGGVVFQRGKKGGGVGGSGGAGQILPEKLACQFLWHCHLAVGYFSPPGILTGLRADKYLPSETQKWKTQTHSISSKQEWESHHCINNY